MGHGPGDKGSCAAGRIQDRPFTLVSRLQYGYDGRRWTEWIAALDGERTGTLSEDNGAFVFSLLFALTQPLPPAEQLRLGAATAVEGQSYTIASNEQVALVALVAAQGELPELGRARALGSNLSTELRLRTVQMAAMVTLLVH